MKRYGGITRNELEQLRHKLQQAGITVPNSDEGTLEGPHGIELALKYDPTVQTLTIRITKKPFWVPPHRIWEIVDQAVTPFAD